MDFNQLEAKLRGLRRLETKVRTSKGLIGVLECQIEKEKKEIKSTEYLVRLAKCCLQNEGFLHVMVVEFFVRGHKQRYVVPWNKWLEGSGFFENIALGGVTVGEYDGAITGFSLKKLSMQELDERARREIFPEINRTPVGEVEQIYRAAAEECNDAYSNGFAVIIGTSGEVLFGLAFVTKEHAERVAADMAARLASANVKKSYTPCKVVATDSYPDDSFMLIWPNTEDCRAVIEERAEQCLRVAKNKYSKKETAVRDRDRS